MKDKKELLTRVILPFIFGIALGQLFLSVHK